jgi:hypothetical protein
LTIGGLIALLIVLGAQATHISLGVVGVLVVIVLVWQLSVRVGPYRKCWRCGGSGHVGGLFGGRRKCPRCKTTGLLPRIGSGKDN